ncbi:efflux transporter outer membrane subunit [Lichenibacterium minor]|uniref:Efflux transporter outer membrane subunit n=1 Tax=Lichenibacterium minor TaxID=2316528 RepID=A0A4Q2U5S8_9HYPH|nr:efflux transporter outer membrane subunit [Lichenibacterium minor]RYC30176.1 efflux transporter outer membrane subunit [Lichenibacterium minor]
MQAKWRTARPASTVGFRTASGLRAALLLGSGLPLAACAVGPDYVKPAAPVPARYKELKGWHPAMPGDSFDRGDWWAVYRDPELDRLERQVNVSNQTLKEAEATYRQAVAVIKEAQAGLFPTVGATYSAIRSHEGSALGSERGTSISSGTTTSTGTTSGTTAGTTTSTGTSGTTTTTTSGGAGTTENTFTPGLTASWDLDVWGRVRRQIQGDVAAAQASDADVANVRLLVQEELATAYFNLRAQDSLHKLLADTAAAYAGTLKISQNQYAAGTAARSDVDNALAQLKGVQATEIGTGVARGQYEHAIAALIGRAPAELTIPVAELGDRAPVAPVRLPATLLQRRPDIANAERTVQQQNELIGVEVAAFYPDVTLSATVAAEGATPLPFSAANAIWSFGGNLTQTLFEGGLRQATTAAAVAAYDLAVATYRQTVLTAFQQVEDDLVALRVLGQESSVEAEAVTAARGAVDVTVNEYRAGTVAYTSVITAQETLLADQETALTIRQNRYLASVAMIQALGGGWTRAQLPGSDALKGAATPPASSPDIASDVFTPKLHL